MKNAALWGVIVVTVGVVASCRIGESLDGYSTGTAGDALADSKDSSVSSEANVGGSAGGGGGKGGSGGEAEGGVGEGGGIGGASGGGGSGGASGGETGGAGGAGGSGGTPEPKCPKGFVEIKPGKLIMGSPKGEPGRFDDEAIHEVILTNGFCVSETEVTQGQYKSVMGVNPSHFSACGNSCPVEQVSWHDAAEYCNKLSEVEGLDRCYEPSGTGYKPVAGRPYDCKGYRLPTEAEWEYAARAGSKAAFYNGNITETDCTLDSNLDKIGWYCGNAGDKTHPVKSKLPNAWKLYDMSGNVREWCHDWYKEHLGTELVTDPFGPSSGSERVLRGGSWSTFARRCRSAWRALNVPKEKFFDVGFRPVKSMPSP